MNGFNKEEVLNRDILKISLRAFYLERIKERIIYVESLKVEV